MPKSLYVIRVLENPKAPAVRRPTPYLNICANAHESRITVDVLRRESATEMPRAVAQAAASVVSFLRPSLKMMIEEAQ